MRKLIVGNWKMNGDLENLSEIAILADRFKHSNLEIIICPPAPYLQHASSISGSVYVGAQDCHTSKSGAFTGDISADMLSNLGVTAVIVGHSERRIHHGETDKIIGQKLYAAQKAGVKPIMCIGETHEEREKGVTLEVLEYQLNRSLDPKIVSTPFVIAYEPIWAIGTGLIPTTKEIEQVHLSCRNLLKHKFGKTAQDIPLIYGGSVKGHNAAEIFAVPNVDGALVGGASLKANDFSPIIEALEKS